MRPLLRCLVFTMTLFPFLVNTSVVTGRSLKRRETAEEICGAANYFICSDGLTCCPDGFLCQGDGCVKASDKTINNPTSTDIVVIVTVTSSREKPPLSTGAIAGIAVGGAIFLIAAGVAIFFCVRKRKIGKEVLKAYEDPSRNMYDQVVVEGKRISVVPVHGNVQQRRQTQTNLSPPTEEQEFQHVEGGSGLASSPYIKEQGLDQQQQQQQQQQHQDRLQQQQHQQYQSYPQEPQHYNQGHNQIQQAMERSADQTYPSTQPAPAYNAVPEALRVGSPISPIRADSMGLIPVIADSEDGSQLPYRFSPGPSMMRHQSTPLPPTPHQNLSSLPHTNSAPAMPIASASPPPQSITSHSPIYYQAPSPPPRSIIPPTLDTYHPSQAYSQRPQDTYRRQPQPAGHYWQYSQYQQHSALPPPSSSPQPTVSPVSPMSSRNPSRHTSQIYANENPRTGDYLHWS